MVPRLFGAAAIPAIYDANGVVTRAGGTADGTKFVNDAGVLAVPVGGSNLTTIAAGSATLGSATITNTANVGGALTVNAGGNFSITDIGVNSGPLYQDFTGNIVGDPDVNHTELGYLNGVTSGIQAQLDALAVWRTNSVTFIASNATTAQLDFSTTPDYISTDVMRANLSLQLTNLIQGRTVTVYLTGDTNANPRTVTVSTNGMTGANVIRWNFNTPTNGTSDFTVTNGMRAELSLKCVGRNSLGTNEVWAVWGPVR